ncbi:MAG: hypothetical protein V3U84_02925 [Thiotrichaceae bacterium]
MEIFSKGNELGVEQRLLPASSYNVMRTLFHQCGQSCIFVPIRSMQYQAIVDETEIIFVYAHKRASVEFAWRHFKPQLRQSLDEPVPYEFVYYDQQALETMQRMQGEFHKFAHQLYDRKHEKQTSNEPDHSTVTTFRPRTPSKDS